MDPEQCAVEPYLHRGRACRRNTGQVLGKGTITSQLISSGRLISFPPPCGVPKWYTGCQPAGSSAAGVPGLAASRACDCTDDVVGVGNPVTAVDLVSSAG